MTNFTQFLVFLLLGSCCVDAQLRICAKPEEAEKCTALHIVSKDFHCVPVDSHLDCLLKLQTNVADFGVFDAEEALLANELQPILSKEFIIIGDVRDTEYASDPFTFQTVVVVRDSLKGGIAGLQKKNYCHPGFTRNKYWTDSVVKAFEKNVLAGKPACGDNATVLETEISQLSEFFGPSCRPGQWTANSYVDRKLKQKYTNLCKLCNADGTCAYKTDTVGTHYGALDCLKLQGGDVAYTSLGAARKYFNKTAHFQYLCKDGTTQPLSTTDPCAWVKQPWPLLITSPTVANTVSGKLKDILPMSNMISQRLTELLAGPSNIVNLFNTSPLPSLTSFLTEARDIPQTSEFNCKRSIKWCTTSEIEHKKCQFLAIAARTHGIKPWIQCPMPLANTTQCLKQISTSNADVAVISTDQGFISRDLYNLTAAAYIEGEPSGYYYHGVIVVNASSTAKSLTDLKNKRACFPSFNGLSWLNFIKTGIEAKLFSESTCAGSTDVTSFFKTACAPGAKDKSINPESDQFGDKLCAACANNCNYNSANQFFGDEGALKCLINDAGDVAFVDYNVFSRYVDTWNKLPNLRVLCKNGVRANLTHIDLENCAYTQVISHEIVAKKNQVLFKDIQYVLEQINEWFGNRRKVFNLFGAFQNQTAVLFPKDGIDLINVHAAQGPYTTDYKDLLTQLKHCSGCSKTTAGVFLLFVMAFFTLI